MYRLLITLTIFGLTYANNHAQTTTKEFPDQTQEDTDLIINISADLSNTMIKPFECQIFPREVQSSLQVILPISDVFTLRLVDEKGNVLFAHYQIFGENQVNLSHLKAAKYFVEISSSKGKIVRRNYQNLNYSITKLADLRPASD
ncbi:MAG: hypothetical protein IPL46_32840 [Saprospiraceae bacterium]|nr:hypothetical protein [Saprospiraceae bacterium]